MLLKQCPNGMSGRGMFLETVLGFMYYFMFFQKSQKSFVNKTFKNFSEASQNRDWAMVIRINFISFFVDGNDFGAGTIFRKDAIYKCELDEVLQVRCDIGSSYAKEVGRNVVVADSCIHVK